MATTLLVVDDHPGFRRSARALLESEGFEVVAEAADGAEALARARAVRPDVALVDVHLPDVDGFEVASRLAALDRPPAVVLISSHDRSDFDDLVPGSSARGFIPKSMLSGRAVEALL
jgi:DNA-binding NarL/FixJ family response regulator